MSGEAETVGIAIINGIAAGCRRTIEGTMSRIYYTLAVPPRAIVIVDDWQAAEVGQGVAAENLPYAVPPGGYLELAIPIYAPAQIEAEIRRFRPCVLAPRPTSEVSRHEALEAWERIE